MQYATINMGELSSSQCWEFLQQNKANSHLIDVRDKQEWQEIGIADLSSIGQETKLISWLIFAPSIHANNNFLDELNKLIADKNANLFFICKSGGRSAQAAKAAIENGYKHCHSVNDGFAGNMFDNNLEPLNLNGWINSNLPRKKL